jgi:hypothetical protein
MCLDTIEAMELMFHRTIEVLRIQPREIITAPMETAIHTQDLMEPRNVVCIITAIKV